jgi:transposase
MRFRKYNECRGLVKSFGERLPSCSAEAFAKKVREFVPEDLAPALGSVLQTIEELPRCRPKRTEC